MTTTIDFDKPHCWPRPLSEFLNARHELLLDWVAGKFSPREWEEEELPHLRRLLQPCSLLGWHCSRLSNAEIDSIRSNGMELPNREMLARRIDAVVQDGLVSDQVAKILKSENQADDLGRAGMLWFCFSPPRGAGESGISRFFRHWGGEALYNSHENNRMTSPILARIGTPCLVEAAVPFSSLPEVLGPEDAIVRTFLIYRGLLPPVDVKYEGRSKMPLPADCVQRIIPFPCKEFLDLTGCEDWEKPLSRNPLGARTEASSPIAEAT